MFPKVIFTDEPLSNVSTKYNIMKEKEELVRPRKVSLQLWFG